MSLIGFIRNLFKSGTVRAANQMLNPNHSWFDYGKLDAFKDNLNTAAEQIADPAQVTNWINSQTGAHMVDAERERNEMQMQNQEDIYQRQVIGMQKAGVNPALMYGGSGPSSAPSAPSPQQPGLSMSDLMQAFLLDKQGRLMESQIRNTDAKTDRESQETERLKLINKYYPQVTETDIRKVLSDIDVNDATIQKIMGEVDLIELDKELKEVDKVIKSAEANEASAFYKARRQYTEAQTDKEKAEKAELVVRAAIEELERNYMANTNTKMGSASIVAIASAIGTLLSNFSVDIPRPAGSVPGDSGLPFDNDSFRSSLKRDLKRLLKWIDDHYTAVD